jgi:sugar phosphate isomerase/epimerase
MGLTIVGGAGLTAAPLAAGAPNAEKLGWRLGCQSWTFHLFPLDEAIDKIAALGLHYVETCSGLRLSKDRPGVTFDLDSPADVREALQKKLAARGVQLKGIGVVPLFKDAAKSRRTFDFAKQMGIETIVSEPDEDAFDTIENLCEEYGINVAIHNHPKPSHYWDPDTVLKVCKGRGKRIGACADTGHWARSGLKPIECLKKLEGRLITFHFKDLNQMGPKAHDVPWGAGVCDVKGMLAELHRQGVKAIFSVESEHHWDNSTPEIAQCVRYFDQTAAELAGGR